MTHIIVASMRILEIRLVAIVVGQYNCTYPNAQVVVPIKVRLKNGRRAHRGILHTLTLFSDRKSWLGGQFSVSCIDFVLYQFLKLLLSFASKTDPSQAARGGWPEIGCGR
jgi:hypothetical protein